MRIAIFAVFLLFTIFPLYSQVTIRGNVRDAVSGNPLENVSIYASDIHKVITTDAAGNFIITGLPKGYLQFQFSLLGYKSAGFVIETDRLDTIFKAALVPDDISTDEIIVNETGNEKSYQSEKIKAKDLMR